MSGRARRARHKAVRRSSVEAAAPTEFGAPLDWREEPPVRFRCSNCGSEATGAWRKVVAGGYRGLHPPKGWTTTLAPDWSSLTFHCSWSCLEAES